MTKYSNTAKSLNGSLHELFSVGDLVVWKEMDLEARGSYLYHQVGRIEQITDYYVTVKFKNNRFAVQAIDVFIGRLVPLDEKHTVVYEAILDLSYKETANLFSALTKYEDDVRMQAVDNTGFCDLVDLTVEEVATSYRYFILSSCFFSYGSKTPTCTGYLEDASTLVRSKIQSRASNQLPMIIGDSIGQLRLPDVQFEVMDVGALLNMEKSAVVGY